MSFHTPFIWIVFVILAFFVVMLAFVILPNIAVMRETVGVRQKIEEAGGNTWKAIVAWFIGMKTIVTAVVGSLAIAIPDILASLKEVDWSGTSLAQYSSIIGLVVVILMAVFHSIGLKTAALATPDAGQGS